MDLVTGGRLRDLVTRGRELVLEVFGRLPGPCRRLLVQVFAPHFTVGAVVVLRHQDDVLMLRSRHARGGWALPGGLLQRGEAPRDALRRELREELRLDLDVDLDEHPTLTLVEPTVRRVDLIYEVRVGSRPSVRVDGTEALEARWAPMSTLCPDDTAGDALVALAQQARRHR